MSQAIYHEFLAMIFLLKARSSFDMHYVISNMNIEINGTMVAKNVKEKSGTQDPEQTT